MRIRFETVEKVTKYAGGVFVAGWFLLTGLIISSPSQPNATTGQTVPYNNHGKFLYITPLEDALLHYRFLNPGYLSAHPPVTGVGRLPEHEQ